MGIFDKKNVIKIGEDDLRDAKLSTLDYSDEKTRKRSFIDVLGARLAMKLLFSQKIEANNEYSLYTIHNVLKEIDLADIYYRGIKIDVRLVFDKNQIFIPRSHFEYDLLPDLYIVLALKDNLSSAEFLGFCEPKSIDKTNANKEFFFVEESQLLRADKLKKFLDNFAKNNESSEFNDLPSGQEELFLPLVDNILGKKEKISLFQSLSKYKMLREKLVEFENFEVISLAAAKMEDMYSDNTLSFVGGKEKSDEDENLITEESLNTTNEDENIKTEGLLKAIDEPLEIQSDIDMAEPIESESFKEFDSEDAEQQSQSPDFDGAALIARGAALGVAGLSLAQELAKGSAEAAAAGAQSQADIVSAGAEIVSDVIDSTFDAGAVLFEKGLKGEDLNSEIEDDEIQERVREQETQDFLDINDLPEFEPVVEEYSLGDEEFDQIKEEIYKELEQDEHPLEEQNLIEDLFEEASEVEPSETFEFSTEGDIEELFETDQPEEILENNVKTLAEDQLLQEIVEEPAVEIDKFLSEESVELVSGLIESEAEILDDGIELSELPDFSDIQAENVELAIAEEVSEEHPEVLVEELNLELAEEIDDSVNIPEELSAEFNPELNVDSIDTEESNLIEGVAGEILEEQLEAQSEGKIEEQVEEQVEEFLEEPFEGHSSETILNEDKETADENVVSPSDVTITEINSDFNFVEADDEMPDLGYMMGDDLDSIQMPNFAYLTQEHVDTQENVSKTLDDGFETDTAYNLDTESISEDALTDIEDESSSVEESSQDFVSNSGQEILIEGYLPELNFENIEPLEDINEFSDTTPNLITEAPKVDIEQEEHKEEVFSLSDFDFKLLEDEPEEKVSGQKEEVIIEKSEQEAETSFEEPVTEEDKGLAFYEDVSVVDKLRSIEGEEEELVVEKKEPVDVFESLDSDDFISQVDDLLNDKGLLAESNAILGDTPALDLEILLEEPVEKSESQSVDEAVKVEAKEDENELLNVLFEDKDESSLLKSIDLSDDELLENAEFVPSEESKEKQSSSVQNVFSNLTAKNKKMVIAASVASVVLVSIVVGTSITNKNQNVVPNDITAAPASVPGEMPQSLDSSAMNPQSNQILGPDVQQLPGEDQSAEFNRDMGKAVSDAFSSDPISATISKVAWEVPEDLAYNDNFRKYLQIAGKNLKLNLQNDLLLATEMAYSNKVIVDLKIGRDGSLKSSDIIVSSGSKQIDKIVLQSVKETLKYLKMPASELNSPSVSATLIINF